MPQLPPTAYRRLVRWLSPSAASTPPVRPVCTALQHAEAQKTARQGGGRRRERVRERGHTGILARGTKHALLLLKARCSPIREKDNRICGPAQLAYVPSPVLAQFPSGREYPLPAHVHTATIDESTRYLDFLARDSATPTARCQSQRPARKAKQSSHDTYLNQHSAVTYERSARDESRPARHTIVRRPERGREGAAF